MRKSDVGRMLAQVIAHGRVFAKGRLHDDEVDSEAGLSLALAIRDFRPGKNSLVTFAKRILERGIIRVLEKNRRYHQMEPGFWGAVKSRQETHLVRDGLSGSKLDVFDLAVQGYERREIDAALGLPRGSAGRILRGLKHVERS